MSDQHRFDCLGVAENNEIQTPAIDGLANDGVFFENSFCVAPSCTPSRYSILTGLYPHQHQGFTNKSTIPSGTDTYPKILQANGYQTKIVGKLHVTPTYLDVGFADMELAEQTPPGRYEDDYHWFLKENNLINEIDLVDQVDELRQFGSREYWDSYGAALSNLPEKYDSTTWIGDKALEAINGWKGDGNFLKVSFIKPHHPFNPPKPWSDMYDPNLLSLLPGWTRDCLERNLKYHEGFFPHKNLTEDKLKQIMAYYYASISHIDYQIGKIIHLLKEKDIYEDTLIVFTSDHGEYLGFQHMLLKGNHLYDPLAKVPLIIKYPNKERDCGRVSTDLVSGIDLAPTILEELSCATGSFMSGSHVETLEKREFIFAESGRGKEYMVRSQSFKLLLSNTREACLFFDLSKDPLELNDLYGDPSYQKEIARHKHALYEEVLFTAPSPVHVDENAKQVKNPNNQAAMKEWNKEKIKSSKFFRN